MWGSNVSPFIFSVGWTRRPEILEGGCCTYCGCKGKFIGIGAGAVAEKDGQVEGLGGLVQFEEKNEEQRPFEADGIEIFSNCSKQAKAKAGEKMDNKGGKGQSVRWKAWW